MGQLKRNMIAAIEDAEICNIATPSVAKEWFSIDLCR